MKILETLSNYLGKGKVFKLLFNLSPMYRRSGGRIVEGSDDFYKVKIKIVFNYKTKNYVGTMYGGHMYSAVDGIYMVQLINILGPKYVVWDKSAEIKFLKPVSETLYVDFIFTEEQIQKIKSDVASEGEINVELPLLLKNKDGITHAKVSKVIYISEKNFYKEKLERKKKLKESASTSNG